jgi:adenine deaminase
LSEFDFRRGCRIVLESGNLGGGLIAPGYIADIVLLDDLETCTVHTVIRAGQMADDELLALRQPIPAIGRNSVKLDPATPQQFAVPACGPTGPVIGLCLLLPS